MTTPDLFTIFADSATREIFSVVANERMVRFREIRDRLNLDPNRAQQSLDVLKEANLVKQESASIDDFNIYYVTSDGLSAQRQLNRLTFAAR